ncbi:hypothetical protein [Paenibacillus sp. HB172176]|uniref:hypothetical protein n=1 Tax=Paenibacillus sp. HB172176 TaxID=2493690 RepID=UPI001438EB14|nr:hypothetical protein [Paenibacillus sp. HB172176]
MTAINQPGKEWNKPQPPILQVLEVQRLQLTEELKELLSQAGSLRGELKSASMSELKQLSCQVRSFEQRIEEHYQTEEARVIPALLDYERDDALFAPSVHFSHLVMESRCREARKELTSFIEEVDSFRGNPQAVDLIKSLDHLLSGLMIMSFCLMMEQKYILPSAEQMLEDDTAGKANNQGIP